MHFLTINTVSVLVFNLKNMKCNAKETMSYIFIKISERFIAIIMIWNHLYRSPLIRKLVKNYILNQLTPGYFQGK